MIIIFLNINKCSITVLLLELSSLLTLLCLKQALMDPKTIFLTTGFTQKMPKSSDSMYSSNSCQKMYDIILPEVDRTHTKLWNLFQFSSGLLAAIIGTKFTISCEFGLYKVKLQYHIFSSMKIEEYMEFVPPGIFRVKLVGKNITKLFLQRDVSF